MVKFLVYYGMKTTAFWIYQLLVVGEHEEEKEEEAKAAAPPVTPTLGPAIQVDLSKPQALHKTCSIFLRNLAPTITKQEVEAVS